MIQQWLTTITLTRLQPRGLQMLRGFLMHKIMAS